MGELPWRHDADGYAYKSYQDAADQWRRQYADKDYLNALEQRLREAEQELKQAAETYVVALDVSEQTWRKEVEAAEQRAERYKVALQAIVTTASEISMGHSSQLKSQIARAALAEPQET